MTKKLKKRLLLIFEAAFGVMILVFIILLLTIRPATWVVTIPLWFAFMSVIGIFVVLKISPLDPNKRISWSESTNDMIVAPGKAFYEQGFGKADMFGETMNADNESKKYTQADKD